MKQKELGEKSDSRNFVILPLLLLLIGLVLYYPTINCRYFFFDDKTVMGSDSIRDLGDIQKIYEGFNTRFIAGISYALNYTFSQDNPFGYYLTNVLLHIANACLLFVLIRLLLSFESSWHSSCPSVNPQTFAFLAAVLFLTHPIQTDAVNYISQRTVILTVMFYMMTMIFYTLANYKRTEGAENRQESYCQRRFPSLRYSKTGRQKFQIFALLSAITAMFCKEIAITLPIMLLLLEIYFLNDWPRDKKKVFRRLLPFFLCALIIPVLLLKTNSQMTGISRIAMSGPVDKSEGGLNVNISRAKGAESISRREYGLTQLNVHRTYLRLLAAPVSLKAWYDFPITAKLFEPKTFLSLLMCLGLVLLGVWLFPRSRLMSFCIFAYFLVLSVESTIIPIGHVIAEYRLYWATAFFCLFLVTGVSLFIRNPKILIGVMCGLMTIYGVMTYQRNMLRSDEVTFWRDIARKSPRLQAAQINLAHALATRGHYEEALIYFADIAESSPSPMSYSNYGTALMRLDKDKEAQRVFEKMTSLLPQDHNAWYKLGLVHMKRGHYSEAVHCFEQVMRLAPFWDISNDYNAALEKHDEMKDG